MIVRWLGAFRKQGSLEEAFNWELTQAPSAVAAERLINGKSAIHHAKIGLLVKNSAVLGAARISGNSYQRQSVRPGLASLPEHRSSHSKTNQRQEVSRTINGGGESWSG